MPKPPGNHHRTTQPDVEIEQPEHFGPRIREIREQRGLSLRTVAGSAGIQPSVLSKFERGGLPTLIPHARCCASFPSPSSSAPIADRPTPTFVFPTVASAPSPARAS